MITRCAPAALALLASIPTLAQSDPEPDRPRDLEPSWWTVRLDAAAYYPAPSGDLRLPSSGTRGQEIDLSDLNLDSPRVAPLGRLSVQRDRWRFTLGGFGYAASDRGAFADEPGQIGGAPFAAGDRLISDLEYQSFELAVSYRVVRHRGEANERGVPRLETGVDLIGGLRAHHASFEVRVDPAGAPAAVTEADADEIFAEPFLGGRLDLDFARTFGIEVESTIGGFTTGDRTSISFTIGPAFVYRPIPSVGLKIGYHMEVVDLSDDDGADEFAWRGSLAGLYWGVQVSF